MERHSTFFTTEHTENCLRATEYCYCLEELRAPRNDPRGAMSLPQVLSYSVALRFLRDLRGEKGHRRRAEP
jgi:hypothetical protein